MDSSGLACGNTGHREELFRLVVEAAPNAMVMVRRDGVITLVNAQAEKLFGYPRSRMVGQLVEMLVPARIHAAHPGMRNGYFGHPSTRPMGVGRDLYGVTSDGREVPIEIGLNPIETAEGSFVLASIIDITERKRAEERLRLVVEAAPNAMIMVNQSGVMTLVNRQTEKLFGYTREELLGQKVEMLVPLRNRRNHPGLREGFFHSPATRYMGIGRDLYGLTRDGREVPIEIGLNPIETAEGAFVLASIIDITERKRAEDAVRSSESRFRLMVSSVKDYAILMLDAQGNIASWNEGAERLKGFSEEEVLGRHFSVFYLPEDAAAGKPEAELRQAVEEGRFEDEGWRLRKDGSRFWANVIITPMRDEQGRLAGFSKVTRDMTERRRSDERFRQVVEAAPNAIIVVSNDGTVTLVNRQTEKLFGYAREELLGQKVELLLPARTRGSHPRLRQGFFSSPTTRSMGTGRDLYGMTKDGREVPIEIGLNPIETAEGAFVLASIIDITERKRGELELRELNQSLESQVEETRRALDQLKVAQNQLVQAEKLASLGGLVAGVAHEINTPVGVGVTAASHLQQEVRGLIRSVQENSLSKTRFEQSLRTFEQAGDIILLNLRRAAELINSFKRVAVDQSSDEKRQVNLKTYIEEVLLSLKPKLKTTKHRIELDCAEDLEVLTTPGALSQILTNLVVNSVTHAFAPEQQGLMTIAVRRDDDQLLLSFSDNGRGIPPEHLSRVFDPFFTTRRGQGGTGLGLHIVFNLVHQTLGGTIQVTSQPGGGTTFSIRF